MPSSGVLHHIPGNPSYHGDFLKGLPDGEGVATWSTGQSYSGTWLAGLPHGRGTGTNVAGDVYEGEWVEGKYEGSGVRTLASGDSYAGQYAKGQAQGAGKWTGKGGKVYRGSFEEGYRSGHGIFTFASGAEYAGQWGRGTYHGFGRLQFADGSCFSGKFERGKRSGEGVETHDSGQQTMVFFENDVEDASKRRVASQSTAKKILDRVSKEVELAMRRADCADIEAGRARSGQSSTQSTWPSEAPAQVHGGNQVSWDDNAVKKGNADDALAKLMSKVMEFKEAVEEVGSSGMCTFPELVSCCVQYDCNEADAEALVERVYGASDPNVPLRSARIVRELERASGDLQEDLPDFPERIVDKVQKALKDRFLSVMRELERCGQAISREMRVVDTNRDGRVTLKQWLAGFENAEVGISASNLTAIHENVREDAKGKEQPEIKWEEVLNELHVAAEDAEEAVDEEAVALRNLLVEAEAVHEALRLADNSLGFEENHRRDWLPTDAVWAALEKIGIMIANPVRRRLLRRCECETTGRGDSKVTLVKYASLMDAAGAALGGRAGPNESVPGAPVYSGGMLGGVPQGEGVGVWNDGRKYEGRWEDGLPNGWGCCVWPDGARYNGQWHRGHYHGTGRRTLVDGTVYEGEYCNGVAQGLGILRLPDGGGTYAGTFARGLRDGCGVLSTPVSVGAMKGEETYAGSWQAGMCGGAGVITYADGRMFFGNFVRGKRAGIGLECGKPEKRDREPWIERQSPLAWTRAGASGKRYREWVVIRHGVVISSVADKRNAREQEGRSGAEDSAALSAGDAVLTAIKARDLVQQFRKDAKGVEAVGVMRSMAAASASTQIQEASKAAIEAARDVHASDSAELTGSSIDADMDAVDVDAVVRNRQQILLDALRRASGGKRRLPRPVFDETVKEMMVGVPPQHMQSLLIDAGKQGIITADYVSFLQQFGDGSSDATMDCLEPLESDDMEKAIKDACAGQTERLKKLMDAGSGKGHEAGLMRWTPFLRFVEAIDRNFDSRHAEHVWSLLFRRYPPPRGSVAGVGPVEAVSAAEFIKRYASVVAPDHSSEGTSSAVVDAADAEGTRFGAIQSAIASSVGQDDGQRLIRLFAPFVKLDEVGRRDGRLYAKELQQGLTSLCGFESPLEVVEEIAAGCELDSDGRVEWIQWLSACESLPMLPCIGIEDWEIEVAATGREALRVRGARAAGQAVLSSLGLEDLSVDEANVAREDALNGLAAIGLVFDKENQPLSAAVAQVAVIAQMAGASSDGSEIELLPLLRWLEVGEVSSNEDVRVQNPSMHSSNANTSRSAADYSEPRLGGSESSNNSRVRFSATKRAAEAPTNPSWDWTAWVDKGLSLLETALQPESESVEKEPVTDEKADKLRGMLFPRLHIISRTLGGHDMSSLKSGTLSKALIGPGRLSSSDAEDMCHWWFAREAQGRGDGCGDSFLAWVKAGAAAAASLRNTKAASGILEDIKRKIVARWGSGATGLRSAWDAFCSGDGTATKASLSRGLALMGIDLKGGQGTLLMSALDGKRDGVIDYDEFCAVLMDKGSEGHSGASRTSAEWTAILKDWTSKLRSSFSNTLEAFKSMDRNRDGRITLSEMRLGLKTAGGLGLKEDDISILFERLDSRGTGFIDYGEFCKAFGGRTASDGEENHFNDVEEGRVAAAPAWDAGLRVLENEIRMVCEGRWDGGAVAAFDEWDSQRGGVLRWEDWYAGLCDLDLGISRSQAESLRKRCAKGKRGDDLWKEDFLRIYGAPGYSNGGRIAQRSTSLLHTGGGAVQPSAPLSTSGTQPGFYNYSLDWPGEIEDDSELPDLSRVADTLGERFSAADKGETKMVTRWVFRSEIERLFGAKAAAHFTALATKKSNDVSSVNYVNFLSDYGWKPRVDEGVNMKCDSVLALMGAQPAVAKYNIGASSSASAGDTAASVNDFNKLMRGDAYQKLVSLLKGEDARGSGILAMGAIRSALRRFLPKLTDSSLNTIAMRAQPFERRDVGVKYMAWLQKERGSAGELQQTGVTESAAKGSESAVMRPLKKREGGASSSGKCVECGSIQGSCDCVIPTLSDGGQLGHAVDLDVEYSKRHSQWTPLHAAASRRQLTRQLVSTMSQFVNAAIDNLGLTPLHIAARNGDEQGILLLLSGGADANAVDATGDSALHKCASAGSTRCMKLLLAAGANSGKVGQRGMIPAQLAVEKLGKRVLPTLKAAGATVEFV